MGGGRDDIRPFQRDPHNKKRPLCKGLDMGQARTRDGSTRHDHRLQANGPTAGSGSPRSNQ